MRRSNRPKRAGVGASADQLERRALLTAAATDLTRFTGTNATHPTAVITLDVAGDLYGVSPDVPSVIYADGGSTMSGALGLWELPHGKTTAVASGVFDETGSDPTVAGGIVADTAGHVYGTFAGTADGTTLGKVHGSIWELSTKKDAAGDTPVAVVRAAFDGTDGDAPAGTPVVDAAGDLFGTTSAGGVNGDGTVWELPAGSATVRVLASFDAASGTGAAGPVYVDTTGAVYGANPTGGAAGRGTVWEVAAGSGTPTVLTDFASTGIGGPAALTTDGAGHFWGAATTADKTVTFELSGTTVSVLASVDTAALPVGGVSLTVDRGTLYGTSGGYGPFGQGYVFEVTPGAAVVRPLAYLTNDDIHEPAGPVVVDAHGDLIGAAVNGGTGQGADNTGFVSGIPDGGVFLVPATTVRAAASAAVGQLVFTVAPTTATVDYVELAPRHVEAEADLGTVVVEVEDTAGHLSHDEDGLTLSLSSSPLDVPIGDPSYATAGVSATATVVGGVATFDHPKLYTPDDGPIFGTYDLLVTDGIDAGGTSATLTVAAPPPPDPGSVTGTVFADANANGVRDPGEAGVGGVAVHLDGTADDRTATTAADGTYAFADVPVDTYALTDDVPAGDAQLVPITPGYTVSVTANDAVSGEDFGQAAAAAVAGPTGAGLRTVGSSLSQEQAVTDAGLDAAGDLFSVASPGGVESVVEVAAGTTTPAAVAPFGAIEYPGGRVVVDAAGDVYGTSTDGVWERPAGAGTVDVIAVTAGTPSSLTADAAGDLFAVVTTSSGNNQTLAEVPADGSGLRVLAAIDVGGPIAADPAGDVVGIGSTQTTGGFDLYELRAGATTTAVLATIDPADTAEAAQPTGLAVDAAGDVYETENTADDAAGPATILELPAGSGTVRRLASARGDLALESDPLVDEAGDVFAVGDTAVGGAVVVELPAGSSTLYPLVSVPVDTAGLSATDLAADAVGNLYGVSTTPFVLNSDTGGSSTTFSVFEVTGQPYAAIPGTVTPTPATTPTPGLTPAAVWAATPATVVAGARVRGLLRVTLTDTATTATGPAKPSVVRVYATRTGGIDADSVLVGTATRRVRLTAGRAMAFTVPVRAARLAAGTYTLIARATDAAGRTIAATAGPALTVEPAIVSLSAAVGPLALRIGRATTVTVTIANAGTVAPTGPVAVSLGLSTDGVTVAVPMAATMRRLAVRPGRSVAVRLRVRVPSATPDGTYRAAVTLTRGGVSDMTVGDAAVTVA